MMDYSKSEQIEMIEISSQQAKEKVDLMETLQTLERTKPFKKLFTDYYLNRYCRRLVGLKASPGMQDDHSQKLIADQLNSIGHLTQFMNFIMLEGRQAEALLHQNGEELDYLMNSEEEEVA